MKHIEEIKFCLPDKLTDIDQEEAIEEMTKDIKPIEGVGFAGWKTKELLRNSLKFNIFGETEEVNLPDLSKYKEELVNKIEETLKKCNELVKMPDLFIFIFPNQDPFIEENMFGSFGFWVHGSAIHLYINTKAKGWLDNLKKSTAHEVAHVISGSKFKMETILEGLIFDGVAEHFREKAVGGETAPWSKAIPEKKSKKILKDLEDNKLLNKKDYKLYQDLFYGKNEYPNWAGYTIGYVIIKEILENSDKKIEEIIKISPKNLFKEYKKIKK